MYPPGRDLHPINWVALWVGGVGGGCMECGWKKKVRNFHLAQLRFALRREPMGFGTSLSKTIALWLFQILHSGIATLVRELVREVYKLWSPSSTEGNDCGNGCDVSQLWLIVRSQVFFTMWHPTDRWSMFSIYDRPVGHTGSTKIPLRRRLALVGSALWHSCHRKILILGITFNFHIQLNFHDSWSCVMLSWALQVANLVVKSPLPVKPQQNESSIFVSGIGTAKTSRTKCCSKIWDNLVVSHDFSMVINPFTLTWDLSATTGPGSLSSTKGDSWHQLSSQKEMVWPLPNFHRIPCLTKSRVRSIHFQAHESACFFLVLEEVIRGTIFRTHLLNPIIIRLGEELSWEFFYKCSVNSTCFTQTQAT